uniref:Uncharacterized protein n=1 Tax=Corethron hystrix TaxID=216773 RepID=A0A7S1BMB9_9STRA|mmetsp:Transcript_33944/g.78370  ORF Transcript_33944/g.78370 Transcript_33944/m.78370 type:complete len:305 (+) Transcript_33944:85-999(+)
MAPRNNPSHYKYHDDYILSIDGTVATFNDRDIGERGASSPASSDYFFSISSVGETFNSDGRGYYSQTSERIYSGSENNMGISSGEEITMSIASYNKPRYDPDILSMDETATTMDETSSVENFTGVVELNRHDAIFNLTSVEDESTVFSDQDAEKVEGEGEKMRSTQVLRSILLSSSTNATDFEDQQAQSKTDDSHKAANASNTIRLEKRQAMSPTLDNEKLSSESKLGRIVSKMTNTDVINCATKHDYKRMLSEHSEFDMLFEDEIDEVLEQWGNMAIALTEVACCNGRSISGLIKGDAALDQK